MGGDAMTTASPRKEGIIRNGGKRPFRWLESLYSLVAVLYKRLLACLLLVVTIVRMEWQWIAMAIITVVVVVVVVV